MYPAAEWIASSQMGDRSPAKSRSKKKAPALERTGGGSRNDLLTTIHGYL
jgi:hypothetical protein